MISDILAGKQVKTASVSQKDGMVESVAHDHTGSFPQGRGFTFLLGSLFGVWAVSSLCQLL